MTSQQSFIGALYKRESHRTKNGPRLAREMIAVLAGLKRWVTRREFAEKWGFSPDGRECRLGREHAHGRILQGQRGFKLMRDATPEEIAESAARIRAQIEA